MYKIFITENNHVLDHQARFIKDMKADSAEWNARAGEWHGMYGFFISENKIFGFGSNYSNQIGTDEFRYYNSPIEIPFLSRLNLRSISCGNAHSVFVTEDNEVYVCGSNEHAQLGLQLESKISLQLIQGFYAVSAVCGDECTFFIDEEGDVVLCGSVGETDYFDSLTKIPKFSPVRIIKVFAGRNYFIFLDEDNDLFICGNAVLSGLSHMGKIPILKPKKIKPFCDSQIISVFCSHYNTFFITSNNKVFVCGHNGHGVLGFEHHNCVEFPTPIPDFKALYLYTDKFYTIFITETGEAFYCGYDPFSLKNQLKITRIPTKIDDFDFKLKVPNFDHLSTQKRFRTTKSSRK